MKTSIVVLCWLAVVAMMVAGCTTSRNEKTTVRATTVGEQYSVQKLVLPEQRIEPFPFRVRKARYTRYATEDLAPTAIVINYLEAIATSGHLPLRVREGFLMKEGDQWSLAEWPPEVVYRQFCAGYPPVISGVYYVAKVK